MVRDNAASSAARQVSRQTFNVDFQALFVGAPNLYLVLTPDFTIVAASDTYLRATRTSRQDILGRHLFDAFPDNPDDPEATGVRNLRESLQRVMQYRRPDVMAVQKYDIPRPPPESGFEERYWSPLNTPVLDEYGVVSWIIHRVEDVTDLVHLQAETDSWNQVSREQVETIRQLKDTNQFLAQQIEDNKTLERRLAQQAKELRAENAVRRETEEKLKSATLFMEAVIENIPELLFVKDAKDHRYLLFNRSGLEFLCYDREELIGRTDHDIFPKEEADGFVAKDNAVLEARVTTEIPEERITTRRGLRTLRTTKVPVLDADGTPRYLLGFSTDITDRKATELQLRQAVKMEAVGQLTGGIAYDFNNLLGVVIGNLDLILDRNNLDLPIRDLAEGALEGALHGADMVQRLLAFSRKQPLEPRVVNLNERVAQVSKMLARSLGEQVQLRIEQGKDLWPTVVDPAQLDETILNLAINARDAMQAGGTLSIETRNVVLDASHAASSVGVAPGDYVMLAVGDTGTGMQPSVVERAFEPFFTTKDVEKGSGLGLSMVYGLVKQSSGHIKIDTEPGRGTTVKVYFPRSSGAGETAKPTATVQPATPRGNGLILIVEDDEGMRSLGVRQIAELGYSTLEARNAKEALTVLDARPDIKLLFTDVIMPGGMTGYELAHAARRTIPNLKVLLTSGYTAQAMAPGFEETERADFLAKPYRKQDLAEKLRTAFSR